MDVISALFCMLNELSTDRNESEKLRRMQATDVKQSIDGRYSTRSSFIKPKFTFHIIT